jgi:hypothetical protein
MFDLVKDRIRSKLSTERPGADVRVFVDRTPYGVWIWDEADRVHVQMKNQEMVRVLGREGLDEYLAALDEYRVAWKDVLGEAPKG